MQATAVSNNGGNQLSNILLLFILLKCKHRKPIAKIYLGLCINTKNGIQTIGNKIDINIKEDRDLIGGVIIRSGDSVVDASLRGRLKELNNIIAQ